MSIRRYAVALPPTVQGGRRVHVEASVSPPRVPGGRARVRVYAVDVFDGEAFVTCGEKEPDRKPQTYSDVSPYPDDPDVDPEGKEVYRALARWTAAERLALYAAIRAAALSPLLGEVTA